MEIEHDNDLEFPTKERVDMLIKVHLKNRYYNEKLFNFGQQFKEKRIELNKSISEITKQMDIERGQLFEIEMGYATAVEYAQVLPKLARELTMDMNDLRKKLMKLPR